MAERERRMTRPYGGVFVARAEVMNAEEVGRALRRMAHEILEHNGGIHNLVLIGLQTGGVTVAGALAGVLAEIEGLEDHAGEAPDEAGSGEEQHDDADDGAPGHVIPVGTLDVALYRDDIGIRPVLPEEVTDIPVDLDGADVVLVDDVLFTGRTIRAALDALVDFGRPRTIQLAVMVDRGHRELPIRPDYTGKNLPTRRDELVNVTLDSVQIGEMAKQ
ncbi:MAG: bifunctional pyr operon transcriptional regulator/uracil phosphoribosyltransferase PyrR [Microthrixaceae bacterium]|nr:bifunctional pyr operon transcriptional regulator/uracil phosphoribosyltransferase PyrR [Microthrixaceae bacterium]MCB9386502.1 bifunctional pyr operon transcriptional regulator/uracil phosphoribosyltransferase PyrR [Microthrixaceae bacterium]MCO5320128.1 bifunctional pyr operon transcriptional regulator/uracil phosphoribosyltransferase PyrR [Microthrixaceae bacterium]